ncbi:hypothetical protein F5884DRAFT_854537 [Xylogone sp. PMI_703]|nr:hypothetical protein F5884DRAFT_854537 [Xylogone sp. PMI_703]
MASAIKYRNLLSRQLRLPYILSTQPIQHPVRPCNISERPNGIRYKGTREINRWSGASKGDHATNKKKQGDIADPQTEGAEIGQKEREQYENIPDNAPDAEQSQGTTERDQGSFNKKAKDEHPGAPEPVMGMNDEKGSKGH